MGKKLTFENGSIREASVEEIEEDDEDEDEDEDEGDTEEHDDS